MLFFEDELSSWSASMLNSSWWTEGVIAILILFEVPYKLGNYTSDIPSARVINFSWVAGWWLTVKNEFAEDQNWNKKLSFGLGVSTGFHDLFLYSFQNWIPNS